ncbi:MAG: hypoxanthine phosphoribosyltransferase [Bacteroidales bacterium]|nr:hypoxanthine phosphoribosyltransferase [Bacteroidales bacterium]
MDTQDFIELNGRRFRRYIDAEELRGIVKSLAGRISADMKGLDVVVCPVLTGSYLFAADITRELDFDARISFVRYTSYEGMHSTGQLKASLRFPDICRGRHVLIIEDIVDTGISMEGMLKELAALEPASVRVCTLMFKPGSFQKDFKVDYVGKEISNEFIVGYGLDYDGVGRMYRDIYILDE